MRCAGVAVLVGAILGLGRVAGAEEEMAFVRTEAPEKWFYVDRTEVTVAAFQTFDSDHVFERFVDSNMPATGIAFSRARAYC